MQLSPNIVPTFSEETQEVAILANLLRNANVDKITSDTEAWHFYNLFNQGLYGIIYDFVTGIGRGIVDLNSIIDILVRSGKGSPVNTEYLKVLAAVDLRKYPVLDYCLENVKKLAVRRKYISIIEAKQRAAMDLNQDIDKILLDTEDEILGIDNVSNKLELVMGEDIVDRRLKGLIARANSTGIYTGWPLMDENLSTGFSPGKVSVIAGRTSMGKSFFKTNIIINQCKNNVGVLNVCPEQGFDSEHDRIDAILSGISLHSITRLREWPVNDPKLGLLKSSSEQVAKWRYCNVPSRSITVAGVRSAIRRAKRAGIPVDVVYIDLFDRLQDVNVAANRTGIISVKLNQIEQVAEEEQVHICLLVQINRGPEGRKDKRPTIADLRDCGNFEQDADMIFLLYREGYYDPALEDNILDVTVAKQRDGIAGTTMQFMILDKNTLSVACIGKRQINGDD